MSQLDYRLVKALDAVITEHGFERAAEKLFITQSAISQRIKQLEKYIGQPLLVRENPPRATQAGKELLGLYRRTQLLEQEVLPKLTATQDKAIRISIATNADSLATWLLPALKDLLISPSIELNLILGDETKNLQHLKNGSVIGAISTEKKTMLGCTSQHLGDLEYVCVASPHFQQRYFADGMTKESVAKAPSVAFDQADNMHLNFLQHYFSIPSNTECTHIVRSSEAFVQMAKMGVAYCLIPRIQIEKELQENALVILDTEKNIIRPLYWHHWTFESETLDQVTQAIIDKARAVF